ncbi:unnamed protein product [Mytilus coruscus]|uniref:Uncharacterized protein n=1 Tax=Mytilus coruscus TaxID=42192 RepID=A0A6J8CMY4_MYTCO|nr:unnamed protein product [Mytilus coruscus]
MSIDYAEVLNTGEWLEMRKELKNYTEKPSDTPPVLTSPESPTSSYYSPDVPPPPTRKRKRKTPTKPNKPTKPDANVICWVEGITQCAPPAADPYEFKSASPSPQLPFDLQPPTPPSTHLSPPATTEPTQTTEKNLLPGNQILAMITELKTQVQVLNNRSLSQELAMSQLIKQNERLITLVQDLTNRPTTFTPHRPWAPSVSDTPTRFQPATARQLQFNTPSAAVPTTPLPNVATATSTRAPTPKIIPSSCIFEVIAAKFQSIPAPHKIAATDLLREFNSSSGPGNFAKHIVELLYPELLHLNAIDSQQRGQYRVKVISPVINADDEKVSLRSIPLISMLHNFKLTDNVLQLWRAYDIGQGKLISWNSIIDKKIPVIQLFVHHDWSYSQFATVGSEVVDREDDDGDDDEEDDNDDNDNDDEDTQNDNYDKDTTPEPVPKKRRTIAKVITCPEEGCTRSFKHSSSLDKHILLGNCNIKEEKLSLADRTKVLYAQKLEDGNLGVSFTKQPANNNNTATDKLNKGWALKVNKPKTIFTQDQKAYLYEKFMIGKTTGRKEDPSKIAEEMRYAFKNGENRFSRSQYPTSQQVASYFSRLVQKGKKIDETDLIAATADTRVLYNVYRNDKPANNKNQRHGGVLIVTTKEFISSEIIKLKTDCEIGWAEINISGTKQICVGSYYRPPSDKGRDFNLGHIDWSIPAFILGKPDAKQHQYLLDIISNHNLHQATDKPTRNDRILDLIYVNNPTCINKVNTLPPIGLADHDIVYVEMGTWLKRVRETPRKIFKYKEVNWNNINNDRNTTLNTINIMYD